MNTDATASPPAAPLAAATIDCADTDQEVRAHVTAALDQWRTPITAALKEMDVSAKKAGAVATLMLCTIEGALILARAEQSLQPLTTVTRELAPHLDSYLIR